MIPKECKHCLAKVEFALIEQDKLICEHCKCELLLEKVEDDTKH